MNKRGYFFIIDALIGITIMMSTLIYFYGIHNFNSPQNQIQRDANSYIDSLTNTQLYRNSNPYKLDLIADGNITNQKNTIFEQINEFDMRQKQGCTYCMDLARNLLSNMTDKNIENKYSIKITFNGQTLLEKTIIKEAAATTKIKTGRIIYTFINNTEIYGPSYAEIMLWQ